MQELLLVGFSYGEVGKVIVCVDQDIKKLEFIIGSELKFFTELLWKVMLGQEIGAYYLCGIHQ